MSSSRKIVSYKDFDINCLVLNKFQDTTTLRGDPYKKMTIGYKYGNKVSPLLLEGPECTSDRGLYYFPTGQMFKEKRFGACASVHVTFDPNNEEHVRYLKVADDIYQAIIAKYMNCNKQFKKANISYEEACSKFPNFVNTETDYYKCTLTSQRFKCYGSSENGECELRTKFFNTDGLTLIEPSTLTNTIRFVPLLRIDNVSCCPMSNICIKLDECVVLEIVNPYCSKQSATISNINKKLLEVVDLKPVHADNKETTLQKYECRNIHEEDTITIEKNDIDRITLGLLIILGLIIFNIISLPLYI